MNWLNSSEVHDVLGGFMSIVDHTQDTVVPYAPDDVFRAAKDALGNRSEFKVESADEVTRMIQLKAGISLMSWGENITATISLNPGGSAISVLSTPKTGVLGGGMLDGGKNRRNINSVLSAISSELPKYKKFVASAPTDANSDTDLQLRKMKSLLDDGIISQDEFDTKKKQLLGI
jgi:hypothetical protein